MYYLCFQFWFTDLHLLLSHIHHHQQQDHYHDGRSRQLLTTTVPFLNETTMLSHSPIPSSATIDRTNHSRRQGAKSLLGAKSSGGSPKKHYPKPIKKQQKGSQLRRSRTGSDVASSPPPQHSATATLSRRNGQKRTSLSRKQSQNAITPAMIREFNARRHKKATGLRQRFPLVGDHLWPRKKHTRFLGFGLIGTSPFPTTRFFFSWRRKRDYICVYPPINSIRLTAISKWLCSWRTFIGFFLLNLPIVVLYIELSISPGG